MWFSWSMTFIKAPWILWSLRRFTMVIPISSWCLSDSLAIPVLNYSSCNTRTPWSWFRSATVRCMWSWWRTLVLSTTLIIMWGMFSSIRWMFILKWDDLYSIWWYWPFTRSFMTYIRRLGLSASSMIAGTWRSWPSTWAIVTRIRRWWSHLPFMMARPWRMLSVMACSGRRWSSTCWMVAWSWRWRPSTWARMLWTRGGWSYAYWMVP